MDLTWYLPPFSFAEPMAGAKADTLTTWWELEIWKCVRNGREKLILKETRDCSGREGGREGGNGSPGWAFHAAGEEQRRLRVCSSRRYAKHMIAVDGERVSASKHILCNAKEMFHCTLAEECYSGSVGAWHERQHPDPDGVTQLSRHHGCTGQEAGFLGKILHRDSV